MKFSKKIGLMMLVLCLCMGIVTDSLMAQSPSQLIITDVKSDFNGTNSTKIYFSAINASGNEIHDISISDIELKIDNILANISQLDQRQYNLVILIDISKPRERAFQDEKIRLEEIINFIARYLESLPSGKAFVKVIAYSKDSTEIVAPTMVMSDASDYLRNYQIEVEAYSCLFTALNEVLTESDMQFENPTVIISFINNFSAVSDRQKANDCDVSQDDFFRTFETVMEKTTLYFINYKGLTSFVSGYEELKRDISAKGAFFEDASSTDELKKRLDDIDKQSPTGYVLTIPDSENPENVSIRVNKYDLEGTWPNDNQKHTPVASTGQTIKFSNLDENQYVMPQETLINFELVDMPENAAKLNLNIEGSFIDSKDIKGVNQISISVDLLPYKDKEVTLSANIVDDDGNSIGSQASVKINVGDITAPVMPGAITTEMPDDTVTSGDAVAKEDEKSGISVIAIILLVLLLILLVFGFTGFILYYISPPVNDYISKKAFPWIKGQFSGIKSRLLSSGKRNHILPNNAATLYQLTILRAQNASLVGKELQVNRSDFYIGRHPDNDLPIMGDRQVSRKHILLKANLGTVQLIEKGKEISEGKFARPLYGTYVDGVRVSNNIRLYSGNVISLGKNTLISIKISE